MASADYASDASSSHSALVKGSSLDDLSFAVNCTLADANNWLLSDRIIPADFIDADIVEQLIKDIEALRDSAIAVKFEIDALMQSDDAAAILDALPRIEGEYEDLQSDIESLDWRCSQAGVPFVEC